VSQVTVQSGVTMVGHCVSSPAVSSGDSMVGSVRQVGAKVARASTTCVLLAAKCINDICNNYFRWETTGHIKVNCFCLLLHALHSVIASFSKTAVRKWLQQHRTDNALTSNSYDDSST